MTPAGFGRLELTLVRSDGSAAGTATGLFRLTGPWGAELAEPVAFPPAEGRAVAVVVAIADGLEAFGLDGPLELTRATLPIASDLEGRVGIRLVGLAFDLAGRVGGKGFDAGR